MAQRLSSRQLQVAQLLGKVRVVAARKDLGGVHVPGILYIAESAARVLGILSIVESAARGDTEALDIFAGGETEKDGWFSSLALIPLAACALFLFFILLFSSLS